MKFLFSFQRAFEFFSIWELVSQFFLWERNLDWNGTHIPQVMQMRKVMIIHSLHNIAHGKILKWSPKKNTRRSYDYSLCVGASALIIIYVTVSIRWSWILFKNCEQQFVSLNDEIGSEFYDLAAKFTWTHFFFRTQNPSITPKSLQRSDGLNSSKEQQQNVRE